jgi:hypothetical protein
MAAKTFEEIYSTLSAEEKKVIDNLLAKEPELKGGWTRQDDYTKKTKELSDERKKLQADVEYGQTMRTWAEKNVPIYDGLVEKGLIDDEGNETWSTQKAELEKQLEEARNAAVGGDMKPEELDARVRAIVQESGLKLTQEEITNLYKNEGRKMAEEVFKEQWTAKETDFNTKTIPFVTGFSTQAAILANHYEQESGEKWTPEKSEELFKLMSQEQVFDALKLEEKFMAPIRDKKARAEEIKAEVDKQVADAKKKLPGGGDGEGRYIPGPDEPVGALQAALESSKGDTDFEATIKRQAVEAAKELVAEGKG